MMNQPIGDFREGDFDPQDPNSGAQVAAVDDGIPLTRPEDSEADQLAFANNPLTDHDLHSEVQSDTSGTSEGDQIFHDQAEDEGRDPQQLIGDSPSDIQAHALERMRVGGAGSPTSGA